MTEESEGPETATEASAAGVDPAAVALALGGASREDAHEFLKDQRKLIEEQIALTRLQAKELAHELKLRHWSLQLRHASAILKFTLEVSLALIGIALVCLIGAMVWNASHDDGLVVEAFSVPPDLAARGLTGQVIATQMLDEFSALQAQSVSVRAPSSYANNWGDDLKVEIPETGISVGEFNRYLHQWLGHQTHISGEVVRTPAGIEITARAGNDTVETVSGSQAEIHSLLKQATEAVFARTQPNRYSAILALQGRGTEEIALLRARTYAGPSSERTWAYYQLSLVLANGGDDAEAYNSAHAAVHLDSGFPPAWDRIAQLARTRGRYEESLSAAQTSLRLLNQRVSKDLLPEYVLSARHSNSEVIAAMTGDHIEDARQYMALFPALDFSADPATQIQQAWLTIGVISPEASINAHSRLARIIASEHDLTEARLFLAEKPGYIAALSNDTRTADGVRKQLFLDRAGQDFGYVQLIVAMESQEWPYVLKLGQELDALNGAVVYPRAELWPLLAYAEAKGGDFAPAHAEIDKTPSDCDQCLRMRAKIDAAQKNYDGAGFWFADAVKQAPSIPFAYADWGQMLLDKGDPDGAIAKFTLANQKGPHFADPLEGWGEALMAKNQSHLALVKFEEANKYAPNWGRLHLKWAEALVYAGKKDDAKKQFAIAAGLDLTASDKTELTRQSPHA